MKPSQQPIALNSYNGALPASGGRSCWWSDGFILPAPLATFSHDPEWPVLGYDQTKLKPVEEIKINHFAVDAAATADASNRQRVEISKIDHQVISSSCNTGNNCGLPHKNSINKRDFRPR